MSERFPGGFMTQSPPTPSASNATGIWTLDQQEQLKQAGQWPPNGPFFIEDLFSTWLYTGNGSTQTITNGIDLSGKGGLVWLKGRDVISNNTLADTTRGTGSYIYSNTADAADTGVTSFITSFNTTGFSLGSGSGVNQSTKLFTSWTFRKQPKFFDIQTWTNGVVNHNLGSVPGCIIYKSTTVAEDWWVLSRKSDGTYVSLSLNTTGANQFTAANAAAAGITATTFDSSIVFGGSGTLVGYFFAHNAGGFGLTGTDNVISCGSKTLVGSGVETVTLGYEPQWVLWKLASSTGNWHIVDVMRGMSQTSAAFLVPNQTGAEAVASGAPYFTATSTGFSTQDYFAAGDYIYIAIRRGPMKVPTSGTSVFAPIAYAGTNTAGQVISGASFPPDLSIFQSRAGAGGAVGMFDDRLRGGTAYLPPSSTAAEGNTAGYYIRSFNMDGVTYGTAYLDYTNSAYNYINWMFARAPGFFDEVCYTGDDAARTLAHNLNVAPELWIIKRRSGVSSWVIGGSVLTSITNSFLILNSNFSVGSITNFFTAPTATTFGFGSGAPSDISINASGSTYVAYLFASCLGVSKVGSYTGTGTTQTINCGFTGGARFVMIKRTDSTGDWYVWDTARGMIPANDPYLLINSTAAEVTGTDYVDTAATGFEITSTAPAAINASGGTFIYLAIA